MRFTHAPLLITFAFLCGCSTATLPVPASAESRAPQTQQQASSQKKSSASEPKPSFAESLASPFVDNRKYNLRCAFHTEEMDSEPGETQIKYVEHVSISNRLTNVEQRYVPVDGDDSLLFSQGYFTEVWSPDEEYLLLPRGRFDGFCLIKSSDALESIKAEQCSDFIRVQTKIGSGEDSAPLWHEFVGWRGNKAFDFKAGLHGDEWLFTYDFVKGALMSYPKSGESFSGVNLKGQVPVIKIR